MNGKIIILAGALTAAAAGQTIRMSQAVDPLPMPVWQPWTNGEHRAVLRMEGEGAAHRVQFRAMFLAGEARLFLRGMDGAAMKALHGPYTGYGPVNLPSFQSMVVAGEALEIEVIGTPTETWPFLIAKVESFTAAESAARNLEAHYRPPAPPKRTGESRTAWVDNELVRYEVVDGEAIREGDVVLGPAAEAGTSSKGARDAHVVKDRRWPQGIVPYSIDPSVSTSYWLKQDIDSGIASWNAKFPGMLVPRTTHANYVTFRRVDGECSSKLGMSGGQQFINLGPGCAFRGVIHEIGHAVGLDHEHTRPDRDSYVEIVWENVIEDKKGNFEIPAAGTTQTAGPYDFESVMHYSNKAFSKNGKVTMVNKKFNAEHADAVGLASFLSGKDQEAIRKKYCDPNVWLVTPTSITPEWEGGVFAVNVQAPPFCSWQASDSAAWIALGGTLAGVGQGSFTISLQPYTGAQPRTASVRVSGFDGVYRNVTVKQSGE